MRYLTNKFPKFCPYCGKCNWERGALYATINQLDDFVKGFTFVCDCGTEYRYKIIDNFQAKSSLF